MESEAEFLQVLQQLKGEEFFQIFKDHQVDINSLKYLTVHHLDKLIPTNLFGPRVIFEHHLQKWQKNTLVTEDHSLESTETQLPQSSPGFLDLFNSNIFNEISIEGVLKESFCGKQILQFYNKNNKMNPKHRPMLSNCIVEYLIANNLTPKREHFGIIAENIAQLFKSEDKQIYYVPAEKLKRKPGGFLYSRYHNCQQKLRKDQLCEPASKSRKTMVESENADPTICYSDEDNIVNQDWLKLNVAPIELVLQKWDNTFSLRKSFIEGDHTLEEIFQEWPLYMQSFGHELIKADFSKMYPNKSDCLTEKWVHFSNYMTRLLYDVRDPECVSLLKEFKESTYSSESQKGMILYLMHFVLKSNSRQSTYASSSKPKKILKASIQDSRNAFMLMGATNMELNSMVKILIDVTYSKKETLQPTLCFVGRSFFEIKEFYVYYGSVFYKFKDILTCLDVAFKIFHVLNIKYSEECKAVWLFLQDYFYDIKLKNSEKTNILTTVLNDIKSTTD